MKLFLILKYWTRDFIAASHVKRYSASHSAFDRKRKEKGLWHSEISFSVSVCVLQCEKCVYRTKSVCCVFMYGLLIIRTIMLKHHTSLFFRSCNDSSSVSLLTPWYTQWMTNRPRQRGLVTSRETQTDHEAGERGRTQSLRLDDNKHLNCQGTQ